GDPRPTEDAKGQTCPPQPGSPKPDGQDQPPTGPPGDKQGPTDPNRKDGPHDGTGIPTNDRPGRSDATPRPAAAPEQGSAPDAKRVQGGTDKANPLERGGATPAPPEYRDGYKGFTEDVSKPASGVKKE